jgi:hypothetical protein
VSPFLVLLCFLDIALPGDQVAADLAQARAFWSLQPLDRGPLPAVRDEGWGRTPIDRFILAKLEEKGLSPSPPASLSDLVRRAYFDVTGLPPSPEEVESFVREESPDAYERLVDRLLASPHYGERWGRHWLDVVRFAETEGFEYDQYVPGAWRYRSYIIRSLNEDRPYDKLVTEQLAGDEIFPENEELQVAAGFLRLGAVRRNAGNQDVASSRNETLSETTDAIGAVFLGLTVGCARCHDHKFDPIPQKDYYRLQAFLAAAREHNVVLATSEEQAAFKAREKAAEEEINKLKAKLKDLSGEARSAVMEEISRAESRMSAPLPALATLRDFPGDITPIHVLKRGDADKKGEPVGMRFLSILIPEGAPELPAATERPRAILARWITDSENPLTARVMVNRIWQYHFGAGIVRTPNDFGRNGDRPTHPELLDYLAARFVEGRWRMKPFHRMILLSSAYRQASRSPAAKVGVEKDPENRFLWRFTRRRLEAEEIRDAMLQVSGRLNAKTGGESVVVPVNQELVDLLYKPSQWAVTESLWERDRRSIYLLAKRNLQLPFMEVFDHPSLQTSCPRRSMSTHAPQALELLNGSTSNGLARSFAERLRREAGPAPIDRVDLAYRLATGRPPTAREIELALTFLESQPLEELALAVFNLNAFLYVE